MPPELLQVEHSATFVSSVMVLLFKALVHAHTRKHQSSPDVVMRLMHCKWIGFEEPGFVLRCLSRLELELLGSGSHTHTQP